jgi:hypothetical protein
MAFSNEKKSKCTWDINVRENKRKIEDFITLNLYLHGNG